MIGRTARITNELHNAWEVWDIDITDPDAPNPLTVEWLEENYGVGWEYIQIADSGWDTLLITEVEEG